MKIIFNDYLHSNNKSRLLEKYGLTEKKLYNLTFETYFPEDETNANADIYQKNPTLWWQVCQKKHLEASKTIYEIMEILHKNFHVGQYRTKSYTDKYDLWFWCNSEGCNHTTPTHTVGNKHYDLSYATLSFEKMENAEKILELLHSLELPDDLAPVKCTISYMLDIKKERTIKLCELFAKTEITLSINETRKKGTFYKLGCNEIRLFIYNGKYAYRRKNESEFYSLGNELILDILIDNNLLEKYIKLLQGEN